MDYEALRKLEAEKESLHAAMRQAEAVGDKAKQNTVRDRLRAIEAEAAAIAASGGLTIKT